MRLEEYLINKGIEKRHISYAPIKEILAKGIYSYLKDKNSLFLFKNEILKALDKLEFNISDYKYRGSFNKRRKAKSTSGRLAMLVIEDGFRDYKIKSDKLLNIVRGVINESGDNSKFELELYNYRRKLIIHKGARIFYLEEYEQLVKDFFKERIKKVNKYLFNLHKH